ncbi:MAG: LptE family protein [Chlamydiota bacterium]|nr:LptE family protein [Chlamydiota bacterium]
MRFTEKSWEIGVFLLCCFLMNGCGGYRLGSNLPGHLRTISIPTFINSTQEPGIEISITNEIINQFQIDGTLSISEDDPDLILHGELIGYRREALRYTGKDFKEVEEYRLRILAKLTLIETDKDQPRWKGRVVEGETTYFVAGDFREIERSAIGTLTEEERSQLPTLEEDLAHDVVDAVVEDW